MATKLASWPEEYRAHHHFNWSLWSSGGVFELNQAEDFPHLTVAQMQIRCARYAVSHHLGHRTGGDKARGTLTVEFWPLDAAVTR